MTREVAQTGDRSASLPRRLLPLAVLLAIPVACYALGLQRYLSLDALARHHDQLRGWIAGNLPLAVALYVVVYAAATALSLPTGALLTIAGGLLFGWAIGAPAAVVGATTGATLVFLLARTSLGTNLAQSVGPWLERLSEGFRKDAFGYLLFLRLVPAIPFVVVNLVPAVLGMPLRTYVLATVIGILPATFAYSYVGTGLGSVIAAEQAAYERCMAASQGVAGAAPCQLSIDPSVLFTRDIAIALLALAAVSLLPIVLRRMTARGKTA